MKVISTYIRLVGHNVQRHLGGKQAAAPATSIPATLSCMPRSVPYLRVLRLCAVLALVVAGAVLTACTAPADTPPQPAASLMRTPTNLRPTPSGTRATSMQAPSGTIPSPVITSEVIRSVASPTPAQMQMDVGNTSPTSTQEPAATGNSQVQGENRYMPISSTSGLLSAAAFGAQPETTSQRITLVRVPARFHSLETIAGPLCYSVALVAGTPQGTILKFVWIMERVPGVPANTPLYTSPDITVRDSVQKDVYATTTIIARQPLPEGIYRVDVYVNGELDHANTFGVYTR